MENEWDDLKKGRFSLIFSSICLSEVLFNAMLGIFPGAFLGQGGAGQKFYILPWLTQKMGDWNGQAFWTEAGFLSQQEYGFIALHLVFLYFGLAFLRRGNDESVEFGLDASDWSWRKEHPITLQVLVPNAVMWVIILGAFSVWAFILIATVSILLVWKKVVPKIEERIVHVPVAVAPNPMHPPKPDQRSDSTQTISDSVAQGDVVGGHKVINDPESIAKAAVEAYRMGISESKDDF
jgi:hypothetical protein